MHYLYNMKIVILTFWQSEDNYGQLLQCFALQRYLQSLGHETFLVRTINNSANKKKSIKEQFSYKLRTAYRLRIYPIYLLKRVISSLCYFIWYREFREHHINRGFENFRQKYLHCSNIYTLTELQQNPPLADTFITGSDQIWNTTDGIYFLSWVYKDIPKIAYAASFGARKNTAEFCDLIKPWLARFNHISVREESGVAICQRAGRNDAICLPDPTLLLDSQDYIPISSNNYPKERYILIYFLGTRTAIRWKEIHTFARKNNLKIIYVASQGQEDKFEKVNATIHDWLALISHAEYVITNSFHGTVFSLIFKRKFLVYPIIGPAAQMNDRIITLLNPLNLSNRWYQKGEISTIKTDIDYQSVYQKLQEKQKSARDILQSWL